MACGCAGGASWAQLRARRDVELCAASKANPRWLWHAIDHHTGTVLAYVFGRRQDTVFLSSKRCWSRLVSRAISPTAGGPTSGMSSPSSTPSGNTHAEDREQAHQLAHADQAVGTSDDLLFQDATMHDLVIGLFINRYEFGVPSDMESTALKHLLVGIHVLRIPGQPYIVLNLTEEHLHLLHELLGDRYAWFYR